MVPRLERRAGHQRDRGRDDQSATVRSTRAWRSRTRAERARALRGRLPQQPRSTCSTAASSLLPNSGFVDPSLPSGFAPFDVQVIGDRVFVAYAKQDEDARGRGRRPGPRASSTSTTSRATCSAGSHGHGQLNAPWGLAMAPASFGAFAGDLLVGNFGDGQINAYARRRRASSRTTASSATPSNRSLAIDGLWALQVGAGREQRHRGNALLHGRPERRDTRALRPDQAG